MEAMAADNSTGVATTMAVADSSMVIAQDNNPLARMVNSPVALVPVIMGNASTLVARNPAVPATVVVASMAPVLVVAHLPR